MFVRLKEEDGLAMIVVLLVSMVLVSLSIAAAALSTHSASSARNDERYYQSFQSAEQGVADYLAILPTTAGGTSTTGLCAANGVTQTLSSAPVREYTLEITLYAVSGKIGCTGPNYTGQRVTQALISSTGRAGSAAAGFVSRTIEQKVNLDPLFGNGANTALYGGQKVTISNNVDVDYFESANDADIYSGGDVIVNNYLDLQGSIFAQGNVSVKGCIGGDIYAKGSVTTSAAYVGGCGTDAQPGADQQSGVNINPGYGYITSSTSTVTLPNSVFAYGSCTNKVGQPLTLGGRCSNQRDPSQSQSPKNCSGSVNVAVGGPEECGVKLATVADPPSITFPKLSYTPANWTASEPAYAIHTYTNCVNARLDIQDYLLGTTPSRQASGTAWTAGSVASGRHVFDINVDCALALASNSAYTLKGNVAILLRGNTTASFETGASGGVTTIASSGGGPWSLFVETPWSLTAGFSLPWTDPVTIATKCGVQGTLANNPLLSYNHRFSTKTDFSGIHFFDYTPCDILTFNQNKSGVGQFVAGEFLYVNNSFTLGYQPIDNPDIAPVGYEPQPIFVREIAD